MTMVMFETLGVVALAAWAEDGGPGDEGTRGRAGLLALALALLLAAGYTKQMALATVVAAFVFLFLRRPRLAVVAAVPFALVAAGLFWGLNQVTGGQWYVNIIAANINAYDFGQAIGLYQQWFRLHTVLILLAAGSAICELYFDRLSIYAIWFAFAVANSGLAGKWGAGESYFTTAVAAACMLGGIAAGRLWTTAERRGPRLAWITSLAISGLFLVQAGLVAHLPTGSPRWAAVAQVLGWPAGTPVGPQPTCAGERPAHLLPYYDAGGYTQVGRPPTPADTAAGWQITQLVASAPGPSLSEDAGFALQAGKDLTANPTQLLNLVQNGLLDSRRMVQWIRERRYGTIVLRAQFYPPAVLQAIGQAYAPVAQVEMNGFVYCVLKPGQ
jgi:hypothetical protein